MLRCNSRETNGVDNNKHMYRDWARGEPRFRPHSRTFRIIETVDDLGNKTRRKEYGKLETTTHKGILEALERRAARGILGEKYMQHISEEAGPRQGDKTGTVDWIADEQERE